MKTVIEFAGIASFLAALASMFMGAFCISDNDSTAAIGFFGGLFFSALTFLLIAAGLHCLGVI